MLLGKKIDHKHRKGNQDVTDESQEQSCMLEDMRAMPSQT